MLQMATNTNNNPRMLEQKGGYQRKEPIHNNASKYKHAFGKRQQTPTTTHEGFNKKMK